MAIIDLNLSTDQGQEIQKIIADGKLSELDIIDIINQEVGEWENSEDLEWMHIGERYYRNNTDIKKRERMAIGESGTLEPVANLANNKLANAFTRKLVDQKVGYLLSKPMSISADNGNYEKFLEPYFGKKFKRQIQSLGTEAINKGIAWLHVYYDDAGKLSFMIIPSEQCIPIWRDAAHTELQAMIRTYQVEVYEGKQKKTITKTEWWDTNGVRRYDKDGVAFIDDVQYMSSFEAYIRAIKNLPEDEELEIGNLYPHVISGSNGQGFNWEKVPFIAFKYNDDELPLIRIIKELVDDYDQQKSDNANNLEDLPNSIYVVKNYGDVNGADFRKNISIYRVVFVGDDGEVKTVNIEINTEAFKDHQDRNRKDIYEFGRGVDTQTDKIGNASGVALKFLYADLDLDCNIIENQFQAALEQLQWFIDTDLKNKGLGDFFNEEVDFIFNRDIIINETEAITNSKDSVGIISNETIVANHPWTTNTREEMKRIKKEKESELEEIDTFNGFGRGKQGEGEENNAE